MGWLDDLGEGIEDGLNDGLGAIEDGIDSGKKALGGSVDWATDKAGERLDSYGMHDAADVVTDWGDGVASDLGATPGEKQLGQTEEANELVHGNPARLRESAGHLRDFQAAFEKVGQGMRKVDSSRWKGLSGDAFREKFGVHPTKWLHAADACETAAVAIEAYAETVKWAQGQAREAVEMYREGKRASEEARATATAEGAAGATVEHDPGKAIVEAAEARLAHVRRQRNSAATDVQTRIKKALAHAPAEPPPLERLGRNAVDGFHAFNTELTHVVGGALKGTAGLVNFARGLNPMEPYNLMHPAAYMQNVSMTLSGLVSTAAHPERAVTAAIDGFKKDESEFIGRLIPEALGTKGTGLGRSGLRFAVREGPTGTLNPATWGVKYGDEFGDASPSSPGVLDDAATHNPTTGVADNASSYLPPGWTIDDAATPSALTGLVDDVPAGKDWDGLAQATDQLDEAAIHADSVDPKTAQEFLDDQYPELKDINEGPGRNTDSGFTYEPHVSADEFDDFGLEQKHQVAAAEISDGAVGFPDNDTAIAYGRENWNEYAENLPESTRKACLEYSDEKGLFPDPRYATYREMNGYLRGDPELGTQDVLRNIEEVDKALAGRRLPEDIMVVRGSGVGHLDFSNPADLVGRVLDDKGYMSTSLGDSAAGAFKDMDSVMHLRVPEGTPAIWMEKVSEFGMGERELLLGRGMTYRVTRAFEDENGQLQIYGEVLPGN